MNHGIDWLSQDGCINVEKYCVEQYFGQIRCKGHEGRSLELEARKLPNSNYSVDLDDKVK